jgi:hypothetical protein
MKGFKQAPKNFGFKTSADSSFQDSGKPVTQQMVRPHFRAKPAACFAQGGPVTKAMGEPGNATVQRKKPVTDFDTSDGGKGSLRTGYAKGGRIPPGKGMGKGTKGKC